MKTTFITFDDGVVEEALPEHAADLEVGIIVRDPWGRTRRIVDLATLDSPLEVFDRNHSASACARLVDALTSRCMGQHFRKSKRWKKSFDDYLLDKPVEFARLFLDGFLRGDSRLDTWKDALAILEEVFPPPGISLPPAPDGAAGLAESASFGPLSDMLDEAGFPDEALSHLRGKARHIRQCWVLAHVTGGASCSTARK